MIDKPRIEYCHSDNEETFSGKNPTIEDAIAEALDEYPEAESIWIGEAKQNTISGYLSNYHVEHLLEGLCESAGEECGEVAERWLEGPDCPRWDTRKSETRDEYNARVIKYRKDKSEWLAGLRGQIAAALETWATEEHEQPGFWHVENTRYLSRAEAEDILNDEPHH